MHTANRLLTAAILTALSTSALAAGPAERALGHLRADGSSVKASAADAFLAKNAKFERDFWASQDIDNFYTVHRSDDLPLARVLAAGVNEWRRSTAGKKIDQDGTRARLATTMGAATGVEVDRLSDRLNILATIGSVAPFVGLFGTVWGIMRSFTSIAAQQNTSLGVVAPGIAEALFATALGLFAAIPAVIAYNRLSHGINKMEARLHRFADNFHATLSRELEAD